MIAVTFQARLSAFLLKYPCLAGAGEGLSAAFAVLEGAYLGGGKALLCGNGGSAADCEHIVGELMKGFTQKRPLPEDDRASFAGFPHGDLLAGKLQGALPAISLVSQTSLISAFVNDVSPALVFAQQVYGYGRPGDVLLALTTSGNSENVVLAAEAAKARGLRVIAITGEAPGAVDPFCDVTIKLPARETKDVQEFTLPVYHFLCQALEDRFFGA